MKFAEFSVKNSLFVNLLSLFILIAGVISLSNLNREAFPHVDFDTVVVSAVYPGATSDEVERLITTPIEKELKDVDDIKEIVSASREGISIIQVEIEPDAKNKDKVVTDIQRAVDRVEDLPEDVDDPLVSDVTSDEFPMIVVSLTDASERDLQRVTDILEDRFLEIKDVASVYYRGYRDKEIWVEVDPQKLGEYYVSFDEVMQALRERNRNVPAGEVKLGDEEFVVRTIGEFQTPEEVEEVIIRANDAGNWLKVKDVARVKWAFEDEDIAYKTLGKRSIGMVVTKKVKGDAVTMVREVKRIADEVVKNEAPGMKVTFAQDLSYYIQRRLNVLKNNGIVGITLVIISLLVFLSRSVAIMTAIGIPIAFMMTFCIMAFFGITINLLTMFGMIIVLGMIVDDGIIISENVYRYIEDGMPPREAAVKGTNEVVKPVIITILTTVVAFSPLMMMKGILGEFLRFIPLIVVIALICSLVEALIILPSHMADFVKKPREKEGKIQSKKSSPWFQKLLNFYTGLLEKVLDKRRVVVIFVFALFIALASYAKFFMPFILFGSAGGEEFYVKLEAPMGTSLEKTNEMLASVEKIIESLPEKELDVYATQIGMTGDAYMSDPYEQRGSHLAQIYVYLTPLAKRDREVSDIADEIREKIKNLKTDFKQISVEIDKGGPPTGKAVAIRIRGEEFDKLEPIAEKFLAFARTIEGVEDIKHDFRMGKGEFRVVVDREAATKSGLSIIQIASTVRSAITGGVATSIKQTKAEEEIDVLVRYPKENRDTLEVFDKLLIRNSFGDLIPLKKVARIEKGHSIDVIRHLDGKRVISVTANVDEKTITSMKANAMIQKHFKDIESENPGITVKYGGEQEDNIEMMQSFLQSGVLALFLIFVILASTFRSLIQPLIILCAIPFATIGVIIAFILHGMVFSMLAFMGMIGLWGVAVNDSIVLIDFINKQRRQGADRRDSLIKAGQMRLRPVILTSITTIFGLFPTAYGLGGFDPFLKPMAISISWGLLFGTVMTLLAIPAVYAVVDDIHCKFYTCGTVKANNNH